MLAQKLRDAEQIGLENQRVQNETKRKREMSEHQRKLAKAHRLVELGRERLICKYKTTFQQIIESMEGELLLLVKNGPISAGTYTTNATERFTNKTGGEGPKKPRYEIKIIADARNDIRFNSNSNTRSFDWDGACGSMAEEFTQIAKEIVSPNAIVTTYSNEYRNGLYNWRNPFQEFWLVWFVE